jgi:hypothetical protein
MLGAGSLMLIWGIYDKIRLNDLKMLGFVG